MKRNALINELTTEQKSVMLAKLVGWQCELGGYSDNRGWCWVNGHGRQVGGLLLENFTDNMTQEEIELFIAPRLYDSDRMSLAWRVLNWASENKIATLHTLIWEHEVLSTLAPPAEAQAAWLDKILELAIEANLVP